MSLFLIDEILENADYFINQKNTKQYKILQIKYIHYYLKDLRLKQIYLNQI